jgi:hypothetical protein
MDREEGGRTDVVWSCTQGCSVLAWLGRRNTLSCLTLLAAEHVSLGYVPGYFSLCHLSPLYRTLPAPRCGSLIRVGLISNLLAGLGRCLLPGCHARSEHPISVVRGVVRAILDRERQHPVTGLAVDDGGNVGDLSSVGGVASVRVVRTQRLEHLEDGVAHVGAVILVVLVADGDGVVGEEDGEGVGCTDGCGLCRGRGRGRGAPLDGGALGRVGDAADKCAGLAVAGVGLGLYRDWVGAFGGGHGGVSATQAVDDGRRDSEERERGGPADAATGVDALVGVLVLEATFWHWCGGCFPRARASFVVLADDSEW